MLIFELADVLRRGFGIQLSLFFGYAVHCSIYILCHVRGVPADVHTGSVLKPLPEGRRLFHHFVLHIDLMILIAREREVEMGEMPVCVHRMKFISIKEIGCGRSFTEEQPIEAGVAESSPFMKERPEWSNSCARTNHDDRRGRIGWKPEALVGLNVDG